MTCQAIAALCMLVFCSCAGSVVLAEEEVRITLYTERVTYDGANATAAWAVKTAGPTWFGTVEMIDRSLYDGPGANAKIMGRAMYTSSKTSHTTETLWYTFVLIVFDDKSRFSGSTLQVAGLNPVKDCEWSIIGGTGKFSMARGIVRRKIINKIPGSTKFSELSIHAYYTPSVDSIEDPSNSNIRQYSGTQA